MPQKIKYIKLTFSLSFFLFFCFIISCQKWIEKHPNKTQKKEKKHRKFTFFPVVYLIPFFLQKKSSKNLTYFFSVFSLKKLNSICQRCFFIFIFKFWRIFFDIKLFCWNMWKEKNRFITEKNWRWILFLQQIYEKKNETRKKCCIFFCWKDLWVLYFKWKTSFFLKQEKKH